MLVGAGVFLSEYLGTAEIGTVRVVFFLMGCLAVVAAYLLGSSLLRSGRAGIFTALTFLWFFGFARYAISSPEAKTPMVLFEIFGGRWALRVLPVGPLSRRISIAVR